MSRKILFIVNPNSGKKISQKVIETIRSEFPQNVYYQIAIWKDKDHFGEIVSLLHSENYTDAVAVGGDGTVNRVAATLLGTDIALGIVPVGSGNGLARTLGLSMGIETSIRQIVEGKTTVIDSGTVNGIPFFCTSGVGFDAHIGELFATAKKRGLWGYIRIIFRELFYYRAKEYILRYENKEVRKKAFLVTVANSGQYGNDFYIAPQAELQDGLFHVALVKPFKFYNAPGLLRHILSRKAFLANSIETFSTHGLEIVRGTEGAIHYDGEPGRGGEVVKFAMRRASLKVIVGEKFKVASYIQEKAEAL